ncbi:MAG: methyltransferase dimerization domain-containing protein, partial [Trueperaceae bacterium]|nr:methyltransferase dimerization domain-containing protein [Trueperaceae bacterium]
MRLGAIAESPLEWWALRAGRVPTPLIDTQLAFAMARTVMVAVRVGAFEALAAGPATSDEVARRCGTAAVPTRRLVHALVGLGYLAPDGRTDRVALTRSSRRWLTAASPASVADKVLFAFDEWRLVEGYEAYVRHGVVEGMHGERAAARGPADAVAASVSGSIAGSAGAAETAAETGADAGADTAAWGRYQRGLRAVAGVSSAEVARRTPVPRGARRLLDLG